MRNVKNAPGNRRVYETKTAPARFFCLHRPAGAMPLAAGEAGPRALSTLRGLRAKYLVTRGFFVLTKYFIRVKLVTMAHSELYRLSADVTPEKRSAIAAIFDRHGLHTIADLDHVSVDDINTIGRLVTE